MDTTCVAPDNISTSLSFISPFPDLPPSLIYLHWALIILIFLLAALTNVGQSHLSSATSTCKSVVFLIFLDSLSYLTLILSSLLLLPAIVLTRPWHNLSPLFLAPMSAFLVAFLSLSRMQPNERPLLTLWLRSSAMLITNDASIHLPYITRALALSRLPPVSNEPRIISLIRADLPISISRAAHIKGSPRPLFTALRTWWHQGSAAALPHALVRTHEIPFWRWKRRMPTHYTALKALEKVGMELGPVAEEDEVDEGEGRRVRVVSVFGQASRRVVHAGFGNIWMVVTGKAGVKGGGEGWWYVGAEIVQGLKAATGVRWLSAEGRYDDVEELWSWVDSLGYGWRRGFQTEGVARALAREARIEEEVVVKASAEVAAGGETALWTGDVKRLAVEVNAVACLGLAVGACVEILQWRLGDICKDIEGIVGAIDGVWRANTSDGAMLMALPEDEWPEAELSKSLFRWVGKAAVDMGSAPAPEF